MFSVDFLAGASPAGPDTSHNGTHIPRTTISAPLQSRMAQDICVLIPNRITSVLIEDVEAEINLEDVKERVQSHPEGNMTDLAWTKPCDKIVEEFEIRVSILLYSFKPS